MSTEAIAKSEAAVSRAERVMSVDVLRGFDMFWIAGGGSIVFALENLGANPVINVAVNQLTHREWEGFVFYDLIFPLFVFLVGVSVVLSMDRIRETGPVPYGRIIRRTLLLFFLGIIYSGGISKGFHEIRLMGVLQRLALSYCFASLLFCHLDTKKLAAVCVGLLLVYWAWLTFVPVPGLGHTSFAMGENWSNWLDQHVLPLRRHDGNWDPEGILSTIPAVATCLLGVFAGKFLKNAPVAHEKKGYYFVAAGIVCVALGYLWGLQFPVIKKIWTSSYVLVAGGYSAVLLGLFYQVIDVWKVRKWTTPFLWIGSNSLVIYLSWNLIQFKVIAQRFVGGEIYEWLGAAGDLAIVTVSLAMLLGLARYLYQKRLFIRL